HVRGGGDAAGLGRHGLDGLGGGHGDHGHAEGHRLDQGEAERGPAVRVQVDAPPGQFGVHAGLRQVLVRPVRETPDLHAEHVERDGGGEAGQQVGAGHAGAADGFVDHDARPGQLAGPEVAGVDDAVLDDPGGRPAVVPEQLVEVGDVDERDVGAAGQRVAGARHVTRGGVVLDVHAGQVAAEPLARQIELVRALVDDHV